MSRNFLGPRRLPPVVHGLAAALLAALSAGCSGDATLDTNFPTVPAKGKVTIAGKPVTKGIIVLEPLMDGGSTQQASGEIQGDGGFELLSPGSKAGAMPGKYRVKVESDQVKASRKGQKPQEITVEVKSGEDLNIDIP